MIQIEWKSSHYHTDGRRRSRPKASTVHGWLVKWRATFSGNERLRKEGMREMREAKAMRKWERQQKAARQAKAGTVSFPRLWLGKKKQHSRAPEGLTRYSSPKRLSRGSTRRLTSPNHSPRPSRRPSHNCRATGDRDAPSSRKASYNSWGNTVQKKRRTTAPT